MNDYASLRIIMKALKPWIFQSTFIYSMYNLKKLVYKETNENMYAFENVKCILLKTLNFLLNFAYFLIAILFMVKIFFVALWKIVCLQNMKCNQIIFQYVFFCSYNDDYL